MANKIIAIIAVCILFSSVCMAANEDYTFSFTESFLNRLLSNYKDVLKENSLHDVKMSLKGNGEIVFKTNYKNFIPASIVMNLVLSKKNQFDIVFKEFDIIGFIPAPKTTLANKIKKSLDEALKTASKKDPEMKNMLTSSVIDGDDTVTLRLKVASPAIKAIPAVDISGVKVNKQIILQGSLGL